VEHTPSGARGNFDRDYADDRLIAAAG